MMRPVRENARQSAAAPAGRRRGRRLERLRLAEVWSGLRREGLRLAAIAQRCLELRRGCRLERLRLAEVWPGRRRRWLALAAVLVLLAGAGAAGAQSPRYAGATLELGIGPRPLALGGAAAAMAGGPEMFRYNPAGLGLTRERQIGLMYAPTFGSIADPLATFHYVGVALPLAAGATMALHWTRFSAGEIPIYPKLEGDSFIDRLRDPALRPDGTPAGYFSDVEDGFFLSFARLFRFTLPLGWLYTDLEVEVPAGLNAKVLRQSLHTSSASGVGIDLGIMARFSLAQLLQLRGAGQLSLGLSALDATQTTLVWNNQREEKIAATLLWGAAYSQPLPFHQSLLTFYWSLRRQEERWPLFGLEYQLRGAALRLGYNQAGLTAGAGLQWRRLRVDYAFTTLDYSGAHRIGCAIGF